MTIPNYFIIPIWLGTINNSMVPKITDQIRSSQNMGCFFPKYGKKHIKKHVPNHQPTRVLLDRKLCPPRRHLLVLLLSGEKFHHVTWSVEPLGYWILDPQMAGAKKKNLQIHHDFGGWYQILRYFKLEIPNSKIWSRDWNFLHWLNHAKTIIYICRISSGSLKKTKNPPI